LDDNGCKDPTAYLTGAVLEDGQRKIADANSVKLKAKKDLSSVNGKLVSAGVYNNLVRKKIQVWIVVRNNADHGYFGEYDTDELQTWWVASRGSSPIVSSKTWRVRDANLHLTCRRQRPDDTGPLA